MVTRRSYSSYDDGCAVAHALDLIGERWALIVVRELLLGPKRFADLQRDIPGISPGMLTQRLHDLEAAGLAHHRTLPAPASVLVYDLTGWGRELEKVNAALALWAADSPRLRLDAGMSPDALVLAMRAHARPLPRGSVRLRVGLSLTDSRAAGRHPIDYVSELTTRRTTIRRAAFDGQFDATVSSTTADWKALVFAITADDVRNVAITGDADAAQSLLSATRFHRPEGT